MPISVDPLPSSNRATLSSEGSKTMSRWLLKKKHAFLKSFGGAIPSDTLCGL